MSREVPIIVELFRRLNAEGIQYAQFKSTLSLAKSFQGKTDFDLLVRKQDAHQFQRILLEYEAKQRHATFNAVYSGMEDYLLYDAEHEQMHHFHVHYDLLFGRGYQKNYRFPDLEKVFAEVETNLEYNIPVVSARFELFLLAMRAILKFDPARRVARQFVRGYRLPAGMKAELDDLLGRVDLGEFQEWLSEAYPDPAPVVLSFLETYRSSSAIGFLRMVRITRSLQCSLGRFQRTDHKTARTFAKMRRYAKRHEVRWLPSGGKIISVIGADGAGKSTLVKDLTHWLNYKLSAKTVYLGKAKGSVGLILLNRVSLILRLFRFLRPARMLGDCQAIVNANSRLRAWKRAKRLTGNGWIVVIDRYPLREFRDMPFPMDGPRLSAPSFFHDKERSLYNQIDPYPDITIVLKVDQETAVARTKKMTTEAQVQQHRDKIEAIDRLTAEPKSIMKVINASDDYNAVRRQAKKFVWDSL